MIPNSRIGPYEIQKSLGAGGMGEVWRAHDSRLDRDVAIKFVTLGFTANADRLRRFEAEARMLAALNHPHILTVFDVGQHEDRPYLVCELLEGQTLRAVLDTGSLPLRTALGHAMQIAQGLAAAHGRGVVHRDLKPENIFVTQDGRIKILDFGLAKLTQPESAFAAETIAQAPIEAGRPEVAGTLSGVDPNAQTALQSARNTTAPGMVLGTPGYMSPEQARGGTADHRSDLFAFGAILYEMLSGERAFRRDTPVEAMAAILRDEPRELLTLNPNLPAGVERIVRRCLEKQPDRRFQNASDLAFALEALSGATLTPAPQPVVPTAQAASGGKAARPFPAGTVITLASFVFALIVIWHPWEQNLPQTSTSSNPQRALHVPIALEPGLSLRADYSRLLAISPDGSRVAFTARDTNGVVRLWIQSLLQPGVTPLPGTENAEDMSFSPDGRSIAYFDHAEGTLEIVSVDGGTPLEVSRRCTGGLGICWPVDDAIYAAPGWTTGIFKYAPQSLAEGLPLTRPDTAKGERAHIWPSVSTDGKFMIYTVWSGGTLDNARIFIQSLATGERRELYAGAQGAVFAGPDLIALARGGAIHAAKFSAASLALVGRPRLVLSSVLMEPRDGSVQLSVARDGSLIYLQGGTHTPRSRIVRVDQLGKKEPWSRHQLNISQFATSPDGQRVAVSLGRPGQVDVEVLTPHQELSLRLSTGGDDYEQFWSADGQRVAWISGRHGHPHLYWRRADALEPEEELLQRPVRPGKGTAFTPNGQAIAFCPGDGAARGIWILPLAPPRQVYPLLAGRDDETDPCFSPDGQWLAYRSNESRNIWILPITTEGSKVARNGPTRQVSVDGGDDPAWSSDSRKLFFQNNGTFFMVESTRSDSFTPGAPKLFCKGDYDSRFGVEPSGTHLLLLERSSDDPVHTSFYYAQRWADEVRRQLNSPTGP